MKENERSNVKGGIDRRSVLSSIATVGGLSLGSGVVYAEPTTEIVTVRSGNKAVETKRVNENWLHQAKRAERAMETLRNRISETSGRTLSFISPDGPTIGGRNSQRLNIYFESDEDLEAASLPDEINGVVIKAGTGFSVTPTCYEQSYDSVEAGAAINRASDSASFDNSWTSGGRIYNSNDKKRVLTVYHALGNLCDTSDETGTNIEQWGDTLGEVVDQHPDHDVIMINNTGSKTIANTVIEESEQHELGGHMTQDGIVHSAENGKEVIQHAINTCETQSPTRGHDGELTCENGQVAITDLVFYDQVSRNHDSGALKVTLQNAQGDYVFAANAIQSFNLTIDESEYDGGAAAYAFTDSLDARYGWTFER